MPNTKYPSSLLSALAAALSAGMMLVGCATDDEAPPESAPQVATSAGVTADWSRGIRAAVADSEYAPTPGEGGFRFVNRAQDLRGVFHDGALVVRDRSGAGEITLSLRAWGREGALELAESVPPEEGDCVAGGRVDLFGACLRRIEYARPGLVEWWENRPDGLEQGFVVSAPPGGEGALVFELAVEGATAEADGDGATLGRQEGGPLRYGSLAAWDETERSLPAWIEETDDGLRIVVDDDGAIGTVTVDPLLTSPDFSAVSGQRDAELGFSVASAGDVNGDGYGDVIIGADGYDNGSTDEGLAAVWLGSASGLVSGSPDWTVESNSANALFGFSVASAGDVNGDGYGDVIVGAPFLSNGTTEEGRAYVYLGSSSGLATTAAWTDESNSSNGHLGASVASAGDVNGDGYGDVIVGAPYLSNGSTEEGRAYVYYGSSTGLATSAAWTQEADSSNVYFGDSVASAGDVNGDGYGDVIVGATGWSNGSSSEGGAFVYLGSSSGLSTSADWTAESDQMAAFFGTSVASAGDVNGDGYGDVIVGADGYDNGSSQEGRAYVYLGSSSGLATSAAWTAESDQASAYFGTSVASAGDVNGDGYGDVAVGAPYYDNGSTDEGRAYVYLGSSSGLASSPVWTVEPNTANTSFGWSVASAGDVNGDGLGDLIVGSPGSDIFAVNGGLVSVYLGAASDLSASAAWTAEGNQTSAGLGWSVASAGDVNGDGYGDVIVSARFYDNGSTDEGRAYLYLGSSSGLDTTAAWTAESDQAYAEFGYTVASAGDVNGDGFGDVIVGSPLYDNGATDEGRAYVYLGSASGLATSAAWTAESDQAGAYFGLSVAAAGDVDGDGYGDVIIGAPYYDNGSSNEGSAFLYLGSASGLATTAAWTAESDQTTAYFGWSVASAGDVDGDGYGDVVVGAPLYDNGSTDEGLAFVYLGSLSGLATTAAWTAESDQTTTYLGWSVASAGDVDGDGYGDVVVGAPYYDNGSTNEGAAFVYLGSSSGLATSAAWTAESDQAGAEFGASVASAGDVNGDGYGDVIVGAYLYDNGATNEGAAFLYPGSASGLDTSVAWTAEPDQTNAYFGYPVAGAGDVNGDGYGDVIVGAYHQDNGSTNEGIASVYLGNGADGTTPLALAPQARQEGATTPIVAGLASSSDEAFDVAMDVARTSNGSGLVALQVEVKPLGELFDGTELVTGSYTASGTSGVAIQETVNGLEAGLGYHWRARVVSSPAEGRPQGSGRWVYGGRSGDSVGGHVFTGAVQTYYVDVDGDGYGDPSTSVVSRAAPSGYVTDSTDCDDGDAAVHPGASEICDALDTDEDCDGLADDADSAPIGRGNFYRDADGDGYGDGANVDAFCDQPSGYVTNNGDCDDTDIAVHRSATEIVGDEIDEDCDGVELCWVDADNDGSAAADGSTVQSTNLACTDASEAASAGDDCDDADPSIYVGATEIVGDGIDQDCDGGEVCYADADGDGYTDGTEIVSSDADCTDAGELGAAQGTGDCDDTDAAYNPGVVESDCTDPNDYNCDGSTQYVDADGDGWAACEDCVDTDAGVNPGAVELVGDGIDQDCDLAELCYADADRDGARGADELLSSDADCSDAGEAYASAAEDCDDADAASSPSALELPGDGVDEDCDGEELCYVDADGDGYTTDAAATVASVNLACDGAGEADATAGAGDCDDADAAFHPGAAEPDCTDSIDYNCDGFTGFSDADADGYPACEECDDGDPAVHPTATEVCNEVDDDCDGTIDLGAADATTWYADADGDGYTDESVSEVACAPSSGYAAASVDPDCDDTDPKIHPLADEIPDDGIDQDCDGADTTGGDDTDDSGGTDDTGAPGKDKGCGCSSSGAATPVWAVIALVGLAAQRRRPGRIPAIRWPNLCRLVRRRLE